MQNSRRSCGVSKFARWKHLYNGIILIPLYTFPWEKNLHYLCLLQVKLTAKAWRAVAVVSVYFTWNIFTNEHWYCIFTRVNLHKFYTACHLIVSIYCAVSNINCFACMVGGPWNHSLMICMLHKFYKTYHLIVSIYCTVSNINCFACMVGPWNQL